MNQQNYFSAPPLYLIPAYGRSYSTPDSALQDWYGGKDFKIDEGGPYCSIRDIAAMKDEYDEIRLLYSPRFPSIQL
jgi:hypothetical protein